MGSSESRIFTLAFSPCRQTHRSSQIFMRQVSEDISKYHNGNQLRKLKNNLPGELMGLEIWIDV